MNTVAKTLADLKFDTNNNMQKGKIRPSYNVKNLNPNLDRIESDNLYHINLKRKDDNFKEQFGDVKFVCMGGTSSRMEKFAHYMKELLDDETHSNLTINDLTGTGDRYSVFKVGPILFVNHGIGCPSLSVVLNEIIKLIHYAGCEDVTFFRVGTCGGLGVRPGTLVVTEEAVDGLFRPEYRQLILGKEVIRSTKCHEQIIKDLINLSERHKKEIEVDIVTGKTLCANDFYEDQGRVDGVFCDYTDEDKLEFLKKCKTNGVCNMEMESLGFSAILSHARIKFAIVCAALLDRLQGDQLTITHEQCLAFQQLPFRLVGLYIKEQLYPEQTKISNQ